MSKPFIDEDDAIKLPAVPATDQEMLVVTPEIGSPKGIPIFSNRRQLQTWERWGSTFTQMFLAFNGASLVGHMVWALTPQYPAVFIVPAVGIVLGLGMLKRKTDKLTQFLITATVVAGLIYGMGSHATHYYYTSGYNK